MANDAALKPVACFVPLATPRSPVAFNFAGVEKPGGVELRQEPMRHAFEVEKGVEVAAFRRSPMPHAFSSRHFVTPQ
jgi:hypothetical protein